MKFIKVMTGLSVAVFAISLAAQQAAQPSAPQSTTVEVRPLTDDDIALLRADIQADKTDLIGRSMQFTDAQSKAFWPLYREYANEQQKIGDQRLALIKDYAAHYDTLTDTKADEFVQRMFRFDEDNNVLRKTYYPKFKAAIGAKQAAKFLQVDNRLNMLINIQLASLIPIIH